MLLRTGPGLIRLIRTLPSACSRAAVTVSAFSAAFEAL
jgi:hypothetical protein